MSRARLTQAECRALAGFFFSDAVGERLLAQGYFADREGWPLTDLGVQARDEWRRRILAEEGNDG